MPPFRDPLLLLPVPTPLVRQMLVGSRTTCGRKELLRQQSEPTNIFIGCLVDSTFPFITRGEQTSAQHLSSTGVAVGSCCGFLQESLTKKYLSDSTFLLLETSIKMCQGHGLRTRYGLTMSWLHGPVIWRKSLLIHQMGVLGSKKSVSAPALLHSMTYRQWLKNWDPSNSDSGPWNYDCPEEMG